MIKKQLYILALLATMPFDLEAQEKNVISGSVSDASSQEPLLGSTVAVYSVPGSTLITGGERRFRGEV